MSPVVRDPVCGMMTDTEHGLAATYQGQTWYFDAEYCRSVFLADPARYAAYREPAPEALAVAACRVAYFSMEVGIDPRMPIYAGGLGILAGDTLRALADLKMPAVGVSLLCTRGYFEQTLDAAGNQSERAAAWDPAAVVRALPGAAQVSIEGRPVVVRAWEYEVRGATGFIVPLILLDTDIDANVPGDREITRSLYAGDERYRLCQEIVLGIGGVRMLRALGYTGIERYHMNEGHASLLAVELLRQAPDPMDLAPAIESVKRRCIFTTHTPVPAGHDQFPYDLVARVLGDVLPLGELRMLGGADRLNMTRLGFNLSHYVNGVARRHRDVSQRMFPGYAIDSITNGVHSFRWTCESFRRLYDHHLPGWAEDPFLLRQAIKIPSEEIWQAHVEAKARLLATVRERSARVLREDALTIGFARRANAYKRPDLVFVNPQRLVEIARTIGPLQLVFAGKAHPRDEAGKEQIRRVFRAAEQLRGIVEVVYLPNYDIDLAQLLTAGVDVWLNTPMPPLEASGTSGMKAAHNGVPSLSVLDGWWIEGHLEGITGWAVGGGPGPTTLTPEQADARDAADLYAKLGAVVAPLYHGNRAAWITLMRRTISLNASFFNAHRMVQQYAARAYL